MRVAPDLIVRDWLDATGGDVAMPGYVERARDELEREREVDAAHFLDYKTDELERVIQAAQQLELGLPARDVRMHARLEVADYIERVVAPHATTPAMLRLPMRLRECRQEFVTAVRLTDGKLFIRWDQKAGLPLLCPDDAREEAMRVSRRVVPRLLELRAQGMRVFSCVLTLPNCAPGELRRTTRRLFGRFRGLLKMRKEGRKRFPQIKGALAVLEAPLGRRRDWHPHLNVILVTDGSYLSFEELRQAWHWDLHIREVKGSRESLKAAMRELIKYSVRAVPEKSKAKHTEEGAPPLVEWTAGEFVEWWTAHRGLRRTRGYGALYGLEDAPKEDMSMLRHVGRGRVQSGRFVHDAPLLRSIPGDKSTTENIRKAIREQWSKLLGPPDLLERARRARQVIENAFPHVLIAQS